MKMRPTLIDSDESYDAEISSRVHSRSRGSGNRVADRAESSDEASNDERLQEPENEGSGDEESDELDEEELDESGDEDSGEDDSDHSSGHDRDTRHRQKKYKSAAKFFDLSASDDDDDDNGYHNSDDFDDYGDDLDSDDDSSQRGYFSRFFKAMDWEYDSDEGPWETLESQRKLYPSLRRLMPKHAALSTPMRQLPITWTGHSRLKNQSFTCFTRLPTELRLQIWELAFEVLGGAPRLLPVIYFSPESSVSTAPSLASFTADLRVLMAINQETRALGISKYPDTLPVEDDGKLWFNSAKDIIYLQNLIWRRAHLFTNPVLGVVDKIENLALLNLFPPRHRDYHIAQLLTTFNAFSRLKNVFLHSQVMSNPASVTEWIQSDRAITIRNIVVEPTNLGINKPYPEIFSFPDIWNHGDSLGSEVVGSDSGSFKEAFREFIALTKERGNPSELPPNPRWDMLASLNFWPLMEIKHMEWPPSMYFESAQGPRLGRSADFPMMTSYSLQNELLNASGPIPTTHVSHNGDEVNDVAEDDDPLQPQYYSEAEEDVFPHGLYQYGVDSDAGHGSPSQAHGTVEMDSEGNILHGSDDDSDGHEDQYESDFVVEDDEVEFVDGSVSDDLLDDDDSDLPSGKQSRGRRAPASVTAISSDESTAESDAAPQKREHSSGDSDSDVSSDSSRPRKQRRVQPSSTGYRGVAMYVSQENRQDKNITGEDEDEDEESVLVRRQGRQRRRVVDDDSDEDAGSDQGTQG